MSDKHPVRRDVRRRALTLTAAATLALGVVIAWGPQALSRLDLPDARFNEIFDISRPAGGLDDRALRARFDQGVMMLHMRQHEYAVIAFHEVLAAAPEFPEAHVNMGFALLGLGQWAQARGFFESAIALRRDQLNAYYGLAVALNELGNLPGAIGAMQSYVHRAPADDPFRARADAALWEWREGAAPAQYGGAAR
ncbi:tetratricopeptide repeat protein [Aromatoleum sp.]|uniref:tetratricopeptide repeat protein n=1 Tax=Aromatoleum sp. TaxID=2307007 RepID=UPI002FCC0AC9